MAQERKEIIQVNGLTMLVVMALMANFLVVGLFARWHNYAVFQEKKLHGRAMTALIKTEHNLKLEIVQLEHVSNWTETAYAKRVGSQ